MPPPTPAPAPARRRRRTRVAVALATAPALVVALLALGGSAGAPPVARAAAATDLGVQLHPLRSGLSPARVERQLDQAAGANARIVRVDVGWASLQPERRGDWDERELARLAGVVAAARRRGLRIVLTLAGSPCWASRAPRARRQRCRGAWWERGVANYLPRRSADYGDALAGLAARYGERVDAWEIWNEPNLDAFARGPRKARRYAALVRAAYARAKPAAPSATFVAGALSESDTRFLKALYRAGMGGHYDALSIHPYSHDASPLDGRMAGMSAASFVRGVPDVRAAMRAQGDAAPLWLTEFGWSTSRRRGSAPWLNGVDERRQALYVAQAIAQLARWDYVPVAIYYGLADQPGGRLDRVANYGLTRRDGRPKPALRAFADAARALYAGAG